VPYTPARVWGAIKAARANSVPDEASQVKRPR
jgi:hypothetical protein